MTSFITLRHYDDNRLGSHIQFFLNQIFYAYHHRYWIQYDMNHLKYTSSVFVEILLRFIDKYNSTLSGIIPEKEEHILLDLDYSQQMYRTLKSIHTDFLSFWREIYPGNVSEDIWKMAPPNYTENIPFDPKKTIAVHLRLDDVHDWWDYDGRISADYYQVRIQKDTNIQEMQHVHKYGWCPNIQSPIPYDRFQVQIDAAKQRFPDHEVVIISSPSTRDLIRVPYRVLCNTDESYDLFLLSIADVVILGRSHFSISAILFGNHSHIYAPLWGQFVLYGFSTKYDRSNDTGLFSYFW